MRRIFSVILALVLILSCSTAAFAEDGKVTYSGNAGQFVFEPGGMDSPTDLFPNFKGVMPGDTLTQKITVKNDADNKVKVKIYMRSLGAHEDSVEFLSKLGLTVKKSEENEMAYMFDAMADEKAQLTDWVCLGTLYSGGEVNLDVELSVPVELDNEFQQLIGFLDWEFMVEEFPIETGDPTPPTGDASHIGLWIALVPCTLAALIILLIWRKKNKEKKEDANQQ